MRAFRLMHNSLLVFCLLFTADLHVCLAETTWVYDGSSSDNSWFNSANWNNGVPTSTDDAIISNNTTAQLPSNYQGTALCRNLQIGNDNNHNPHLIITLNSTLATSQNEYVGYYQWGFVDQKGGQNSADRVFMGYGSSAANGEYEIDDGQLAVTHQAYIGYDSVATFTQNGGAVNTSVGSLTLGARTGAYGYYNLHAGSITCHSEIIGDSGTGYFTQFNGSNTVIGTLSLGYGKNSSGIYVLKGGTLKTNVYIEIGSNGTGELELSGGSLLSPEIDLYNSGTIIADVVSTINSPCFVSGGTVSIPEESNSLTLTKALTISSAVLHKDGTGMLTVTGGIRVNTGGTLSVDEGVLAINTTAINEPMLTFNTATSSKIIVDGVNCSVQSITGNGTTEVLSGQLTCGSIVQDTLIIGKEATVVAVPEPTMLSLIVAATILLGIRICRRR